MAFTESVDRYTMKEYFDNFYRNMEYKPMTQNEFLEKHPMFEHIIKHSINRWVNKTFFIMTKDKDGIVREVLHLFSDKHHYSIVIHKDEYIGGGVKNRYQYVFEKQHRGCDLSDGKYTIETLCDIMADIVGYELIAVDVRPSVFEEED